MALEARACSECGAELSSEVGCPRCFLSLGLNHEDLTASETWTTDLPEAEPATRIGPYRLLGTLGQGGMGIVYLAEQEEPIRRRVALKLIKLGMDTKQVLARFESERQALAILNHPHIARVYDGGTTREGRPYFVMEHVAGIPITRFCDRERLDTRQRLELFVEVCEAVQHAHQKGIIHRDLKPSNVLVSLQDGSPAPKVIDFGMAKATSQRLTERTLYTELGALVGTPGYMSPEQADPSALDIDTRTDIYSLGLILYELLAGALPFDPRRLREAGFGEMLRILREEEPPRPSARLSTLETASQAARQRRSDVRSLRSALRGDLDWIVLRALEKDWARRYASASELAADIRRHLQDDPVLARPPSLGYRSGKFVRKYRGTVAAVAAVVTTIVLLGSVALFLGVRERQQAERVRANAVLLAAAAADDPLLKVLLLDEVADSRDLTGRLAIAHEAASTPLPIHVLRGHEGLVCGASFSPDGKWALTAASDNTAVLWRLDGSEASRVVARHQDWIRSAVFSPDGSRILTGSDDETARVWRLDGAAEPIILEGHENWVWSADFSPDGEHVVTASRDGTARVWRADGRGEPIVLRGHEVDQRSPSFSDYDGSRIPSSSADVRSAVFSPDGRTVVTAAMDGTARVWRAAGGGDPLVLRGHDGVVFSAAFHPDGSRIATASGDGTVRLWSARDGEPLGVLRGHDGPVHGVRFSPDGARLVTASADGSIRIWPLDGPGETLVLRGHEGRVQSAAFSRDGSMVLSASDDGTVRVWPAGWNPQRVVLRGHQGPVARAAFSPDGTRVVTASDDGTARVWQVKGKDLPLVLRGHEGVVNDAAFSPDGSLVATASDDHTARVWDIGGSGETVVLRGHRAEVVRAVFGPDGRRIATASADGTARIWRVDGTGEPVVLRGHQKRVTAVTFSDDGLRLATGSNDGTVRVWRVDGVGEPVILTGDRGAVWSVAFNADATLLVVAYEGDTAQVWRADGTEAPVVLAGHQDWVRSAAFSPDGDHVVTASDDQWARVWRSDGEGEPVVLKGHQDYVVGAVFSPDGDHVLTASWDGTARVWRADGAGEPVVLRGHEGHVTSAAFSPDGTRVVTASADGTARIWLVSWRALLEHLRGSTRACLTVEQRMRFLAETAAAAQAAFSACERPYM